MVNINNCYILKPIIYLADIICLFQHLQLHVIKEQQTWWCG